MDPDPIQSQKTSRKVDLTTIFLLLFVVSITIYISVFLYKYLTDDKIFRSSTTSLQSPSNSGTSAVTVSDPERVIVIDEDRFYENVDIKNLEIESISTVSDELVNIILVASTGRKFSVDIREFVNSNNSDIPLKTSEFSSQYKAGDNVEISVAYIPTYSKLTRDELFARNSNRTDIDENMKNQVLKYYGNFGVEKAETGLRDSINFSDENIFVFDNKKYLLRKILKEGSY